MITPYGITEQTTFLDMGKKVPKNRLTHNKYFWFSSRKHLNKRTPQGQLPPLIYGKFLLITIHYIHSIRIANSDRNIVIAKYDIILAYRRGSSSGNFSAIYMNVVSGISIISFRITFGGSFWPFTWCLLMEIATDLETYLLRCDVCNPHNLNPPHANKI